MSKLIDFEAAARSKLKEGVDKLADTDAYRGAVQRAVFAARP